jgi:hypothetical protein
MDAQLVIIASRFDTYESEQRLAIETLERIRATADEHIRWMDGGDAPVQAPPPPVTAPVEAPRKRRNLSAAGRLSIQRAQRRRWRLYHAQRA